MCVKLCLVSTSDVPVMSQRCLVWCMAEEGKQLSQSERQRCFADNKITFESEIPHKHSVRKQRPNHENSGNCPCHMKLSARFAPLPFVTTGATDCCCAKRSTRIISQWLERCNLAQLQTHNTIDIGNLKTRRSSFLLDAWDRRNIIFRKILRGRDITFRELEAERDHGQF